MSDCYGDPRWGETDNSQSRRQTEALNRTRDEHGRENDEEEYAAQARHRPVGQRSREADRRRQCGCCEPDQRAFLESPGEAAIVEKRKIPFEAIAARRNESKLRVRVQRCKQQVQ